MWAASLTEVGTYYLEHGDYPPSLKDQPPKRRPATRRAQKPAAEPPPRVGINEPLGPPAPTDAQRLYLRVLHEGRLEIVDRQFGAAARALQESKLAPDGKVLKSSRRGWHHQMLYFVDNPQVDVPTRMVSVPARLARAHAVARAYRDDPNHHEVSAQHLARAVRIVHALATTFDDLGFAMTYEVGRTPDGQFKVRSGAWGESLRLSEKSAPGGAPQPHYNLRRGKPLPAWQSRRQKQFVSTGILSVQVGVAYGARGGRQQRFGDRRRHALEDVLGNAVREIEMRFLERHQEEEEAQRQDREQEDRWQRVLLEAEARAIEEHRAGVLRSRASAWQTWQIEWDYVEGLAARLHEVPDEERAAVAEWIAWSRQRLAGTDPLATRHSMPASPEPTREFLEPHVRGWSGHLRTFPA